MLKFIFSWKFLRICILLFILLLVWQNSQTQKTLSTNWESALDVIYYPVNADGLATTSDYIATLDSKDLASINSFLIKQGRQYQVDLSTVANFTIDNSVNKTPPLPPINGSMLANIWWSLQFRWWSRQHKPENHSIWQIRLFVLYYTPKNNLQLPHSTGLQKGLVGIVNLFARQDQEKINNIITAHELLHTLGASDKYDLVTGQPIFPDGYANSKKSPLYPQTKSEIMAVQKAISENTKEFPVSLNSVVVGVKTAREIGWVK